MTDRVTTDTTNAKTRRMELPLVLNRTDWDPA